MYTRSVYRYQFSANPYLAIACLSAVLGLAACQPEGQAEKAGQKVDKALENAGQKVEQTAEKAELKIEAAKESVVQEAGKANDASNDALEKAGKQIDKAINNSEKRIETAKDSVADSAKAAGEYLDDSAITGKIKATLLNDDFLKLTPIEVSTVNGVVSLRGTVDSELLVSRAIGVASSQEHVKSVKNELLVKTSKPSIQ